MISRLANLALPPAVMGILNITADSFYDGGKYLSREAAITQARLLITAGADIIDVGGESTHPGASPISLQAEIDAVIPVIEMIRAEFSIPISIDTSKPEVMQAAVQAGVSLINDVRALREPGALEMAATLQVPLCLMHMKGEPKTMQENPQYDDVIVEIMDFLQERINACEAAGIAKSQLMLDPGFGFGKTKHHNMILMNKLDELHQLGLPLMLGVSRKKSIGEILQCEPQDRLAGSLAMTSVGAMKGVRIFRCHDVKETRDVVMMIHAMQRALEEEK